MVETDPIDKHFSSPKFKACAIRPACLEDSDLILGMRNQKLVRSSMLNQDIIPECDHKEWFNTVLKGDDATYFIFSYNKNPTGVIGFYNIKHHTANWSFYLGTKDIPHGLGAIICFLGLEYIFKTGDIQSIETSILNQNVKSQNLHSNLGFDKDGISKITNATLYSLRRNTWNNHKSTYFNNHIRTKK